MEFISHIILIDTFIFNHEHPENYIYAFNTGFSKVMKSNLSHYQLEHMLKRYNKLYEITVDLLDKRYAVICDYRIKRLQKSLVNNGYY